MDATQVFLILGGVGQVIVAALILHADGRLRLRASLAALFLLNGTQALALTILPSDRGALWQQALDAPTGSFLVDAGVLLSAGRLRRWESASATLAIAALILLPIRVLTQPLGGDLLSSRVADVTVYLGFAVALVGSWMGAEGAGTRFHVAAFLAFAPRAIEYAWYAGADLFRILVGVHSFDPSDVRFVWRVPLTILVIGALVLILRRARGARMTEVLVAVVLGTLFWSAVYFDAAPSPLVQFATFLLSRPVFFVAAVALVTPEDPLWIAPAETSRRVGLAIAGAVLGLALGDAATSRLSLSAYFSLALSLVGYALGGLLATRANDADDAAAPSGAGAPAPDLDLTQGERLLVALRGVRVVPGKSGPAACGTSAISAATGIPGKHVPTVVRRLNDRADRAGTPRLVHVDLGDVDGVRRRGVPRYVLTPAGEEAAERIRAQRATPVQS